MNISDTKRRWRAERRAAHYHTFTQMHPALRIDALAGMKMIRERFANGSPGGELPESLHSREVMDLEHQRQGRWMQRYGACDQGCSTDNLVTLDSLNGFRVACKFTLSDCPRMKLGRIIDAYRRINREQL